MIQNLNVILGFVDKSLSIACNALWQVKDYFKLLREAASHLTYLETVKSKRLPDADSLHYHVEDDSINTNKLRRELLKKTEKQLRKYIHRFVILIIDYTYEPFYGDIKNNLVWIHDYKPVRGCNGCFKFLSASIVCDDERLFIDSIPVSRFTNKLKMIEETLNRLKKLRINVAVVLMDRGFSKDPEVIRLLGERKLRYLMLYPKYENVKQVLTECGDLEKIPFKVGDVETNLVVINDRKHVWTFVTNLELRRFWRYLKVYRKRWNIETGFRVCDEARIKTKSLDIRVRYFLFSIAMLLYNIWYIIGRPTSFKRLIIRFEELFGGVLNGFKST